METIRRLTVSRGATSREVEVLRKPNGSYWLHDLADINFDSLEQLQDDSDMAVNDAICCNDFTIVE